MVRNSLTHLTGVLCLLFFCFSNIHAQKDSLRQVLSQELEITDRVDALHQLISILVSQHPDSALMHAHEAISLTRDLDDVKRHSRSFRRLGHASYVSGNLDLLRSSLLDYIKYCEVTNQPKEIAASYRNLSKIGEATKQPDSSLFYLDKCLEILNEHPDSIIMVDVFLSKGLSYKYKGYYQMSLEALLNGLRISEALERPYKKGYLNMNLAITAATMDQLNESATYSTAAIENFKEDGNLRGVTRTQNNLGIALDHLGRHDEAKEQLLLAIENSVQTKMPNIAMHAYFQLAQIALDQNDYSNADEYSRKAESIANNLNDVFTIGSITRFKAKLAFIQGNSSQANNFVQRARNFFNSYREPIEESETYFEMADLLERSGDHEEALSFIKKGNSLHDSLYTIKKEKQFEELNLIYETEKKNSEIQLLNKNVELEQTKQQRLWGGLGLISLLGLSIIFNQYRVRRKEKVIATREKEIEIEKRKRAEEQLEHKKKELTTKALQLAGKNEFLLSLEQEIKQLKSSVDDSVNKASRKLSRMIHNDANEEEEWEQFGKEFSSIHKGFQEKLKEKYGSFTNSEWRLISLLKMNLSSKDIANILRISADGVKKARYRLRKKMNLESNVDIQDYLLSL